MARIVTKDRALDPIDVVAEVKVNVRSKAGGRKGVSCSQTIAVERKDNVVSARDNVAAVNLELHLRMCARVVAVAEADVDHRLRGRTET